MVRCAGALLGIPAGGSAEGRATIPATTQLTVSLSRGAAFSVTEATDTGRHLGPRTPCTFTVTVRFTPTALARRTVARLLATNPRSRPGDGEVSAALEPSAAYLDFVFETARACAAELTPIETPGAVGLGGLGGLGGLADLEDRTDPDRVVALSDMFTDNGGPLTTQADRAPPLGGYVHA